MSEADLSFQQGVRSVIGALRAAILEALDEPVGGLGRSPAELSRDLGLDTKLGWKLHRLLSDEDPFAAALFVPGRSGVGLIIDGLRRVCDKEAVLDRVRQAGEDFQACVSNHADNRAGFDVLLSVQTNDERSSIEHRKLAYQGVRSVWGIESVCNMLTYMIHPSEDGESMDVASIRGIIGCQRLRENVPWRIARFTMRRPDRVEAQFQREAVDPSLRGTNPGDELPVLRTFCSDPLPAIERVPSPLGAVEYQLGEGPVGKQGRFDLVTGEVARAVQSRFARPGDPPLRARFAVRIPTQQVVFDVMMHRDMFARSTPKAKVVSDLFATDLGSQPQPQDEIPIRLSPETLRASPGVLSIEACPKYADAVDEALGTLGWSPEAFDVYRMRVQYPPVPTTLVFEFDSAAARAKPE
ncbi:MAG: hypothetical protein AAGA55_00010 [Planctomycetota bacterium]